MQDSSRDTLRSTNDGHTDGGIVTSGHGYHNPVFTFSSPAATLNRAEQRGAARHRVLSQRLSIDYDRGRLVHEFRQER